MNKQQIRVLYRQFLFRVFDLEVLSPHAQGDANKLLGQFAALLVFVSFTLSLGALLLANPGTAISDPHDSVLVFAMIAQHFLIATTMLVVGLFAVLSWDATFPDRRDVLVLAPLPLRARTMFLAKVAAVATSLGLTIILLHGALGLICPVVFALRATPAVLPAMAFDPTPVPLAVGDLQAQMNRDLRQALMSGELAPGTGAGLAIGVWKGGERRIFTYGAAKRDSLFEIGSISKTFTGLILARMVTQGKVHLDEPVRELLPAGTVAKPAGSSKDQEITLLDLVTHHSGLPSIPSNFYPADPTNPYADYAPQDLYAYVAKRGVRKPADVTFVYSNLGVGLLGQALAVRAGRSYADLLREEITGPLGLADTVVDFSAEQRRRFMQGYDDGHRRVRAWDLDALAGAGAIRSTAGDMLTYLEANLHPEKFAGLSSAMTLSHQIRESADEGGQIALAWLYSRASDGIYWHGGATAGFTSDVFFNPREDCAAVVLMNSGPNLLLRADVIGEHIRQRLSGQPAISLETVLVPASRGLRGLLRSFCAYWFTMLAAGVFVYGAVLGAQGLAAQILPRKFFLRVSGHLQLAAICLIVGMYFLQPGFGGLDDLTVGSIWRIFQWLPSYCFLALYQQLNGSMHPALEPMARRAWTELGCVVFGTGVVYTLSYWRTLRKIVEEPDIVPGRQRFGWLPRFGNHTQTAIGQFSVRTLARSKQHRLILCFYLGVGLAFTSLLLKGSKAAVNNPWRERSMLLWAASIMMMVLASFGTRVAFAMPLDLRGNWIFRVTGARGGLENLEASRRALLLLSVTPVWVVTAIVCLGLWPGRQSAAHLIVLAFAGLIVADICLLRFQKIPFTCSYLPGKSRVHIAFLGSLGVLLVGTDAAQLERHALREIGSTMVMLAVLFAVWICVRYATEALAKREEQELRFEEETAPAVLALGLYRDGVMPIVNEPATRTT